MTHIIESPFFYLYLCNNKIIKEHFLQFPDSYFLTSGILPDLRIHHPD